MKFLTITKSKPIKLSVDTALKAGTPISITGEVANDDTAIGLVAKNTAAGAERIAIVTEGMVDVNEIAASYGTALTDDCMTALHGITFLYGGKAIVPAGGGGGSGLPDWSEASDGDVLAIEDGAPAWKEQSGGGDGTFAITLNGSTKDKTDAEIIEAVEAGKTIVIYPISGTTKLPPCIAKTEISNGAIQVCYGTVVDISASNQNQVWLYRVGKTFAAGGWFVAAAALLDASFPMD